MTFTFDGFEPANTTPVPDILFDVLLPELNEAQLKVMLYIIRRTLGFKKTEDAISLKQFRFGIITREKKRLDNGCGLKNFTTISKALKALEAMNCIERTTAKTADGDDATTLYKVRFRGTTVNVVPTTDDVVPSYAKRSTRTTPDGVGVLRETEPQLNSNTRNSLQETVIQEGTFATSLQEDRTAPTNIIDFKKATDPSLKAIDLSHSQVDIGNLEETAKRPAIVAKEPVHETRSATDTDIRHTDHGTAHSSSISHDNNNPGNDMDARGMVDAPQEVAQQKPGAGTLVSLADTPPSVSTGGAAGVQALSSDAVTPAQRSGSPLGISANAGAAQAGVIPKRPTAKQPPVMPKSDTKEIQRRINEHRGYALEEKGQIIQERIAIKSWCNMHSLEEFGLVMSGLKKDKYWGKQEHYYRIGGLILLKETPAILARLREPLPMASNGNGHHSDMEGLVSRNGLVLWKGQWMTEEEADETGFNGGFGLYK